MDLLLEDGRRLTVLRGETPNPPTNPTGGQPRTGGADCGLCANLSIPTIPQGFPPVPAITSQDPDGGWRCRDSEGNDVFGQLSDTPACATVAQCAAARVRPQCCIDAEQRAAANRGESR